MAASGNCNTSGSSDGVSILQAYDVSRADDLSKAWFNEIINGVEGDFGDQTYLYLRAKDHGQFMADYQHMPGPVIGNCYSPNSGCGWPAPFGVPQMCDPAKPWLRDVNSLKRTTHYELQDAMGLDRNALAKDDRPYYASMADCTRTLQTGPCKGITYPMKPNEKVALRSVPSYPTWYYGHGVRS